MLLAALLFGCVAVATGHEIEPTLSSIHRSHFPTQNARSREGGRSISTRVFGGEQCGITHNMEAKWAHD
uniref:Putative secreted protein n=1 Tax=Anopheles marajoara TaxID=58244 RepID=A0A2M4CEQ5_9DIPT